jgi:hypothetical protein
LRDTIKHTAVRNQEQETKEDMLQILQKIVVTFEEQHEHTAEQPRPYSKPQKLLVQRLELDLI